MTRVIRPDHGAMAVAKTDKPREPRDLTDVNTKAADAAVAALEPSNRGGGAKRAGDDQRDK